MGTNNKLASHHIVVDRNIRPQDDFYHHVCSNWLKQNPRPPNQSCWGHFSDLATRVDCQLEQIFTDWLKPGAKLRPPQKQAVDLYKLYLAKDRLSAAGAKTLLKTHQQLIADCTTDNLAQNLGRLTRTGLATFWDFSVDADNQNPDSFILSLDQPGLTLPDRSYYLERSGRFQTCRLAYRRFIRLFWRQVQVELQRFGGSDRLGRLRPVKLLKIETQLAQWSAPTEDLNHPRRSTNLYSLFELQATFDFDWPAYFEGLGLPKPPRYVNVAQPEFLAAAVKWLGDAKQADINLYLTWQLLLGLSPHVSESLTDDYFDFFGRTLHGQSEVKPLKLRARQFVSRELLDTIGREYVRRHFPAKTQAAVTELTEEVRQAFARRLESSKWMGEDSRRQALEKLEKIAVNLGKPKTWASYESLAVDRRNLLKTQLKLAEFNSDQSLNLLGQKPKRQNFNLGPGPYGAQVVDAWTDPCLLTTNYTAAILQPPFYDPDADWAFNLGTIGSVIGHELTHHFDNLGAHYDPQGLLREWLKPSERRAFDKAAQPLVAAADRFEVLPGVRLRGSQVLGEALADLGGLVLVTDVVDRHYKNPALRHQIYRRVLEAYAYYNAQNPTDEFRVSQTLSDEHPDSVFRVNGIVGHLPAFYQAYDLKPTDKLYIPPAGRAKVW